MAVKTKYTWTEPYVDNTQVFAVKKDGGITSAADLAGKIVLDSGRLFRTGSIKG